MSSRPLTPPCVPLGESESGKTSKYIEPNIIQKNASFVINDLRGVAYEKYGKWLSKQGYAVNVIDVYDFNHSDYYNPFKYIRTDTMEHNINRIVDVLINNTSGLWPHFDKESFKVKVERLLLTSYISMMICLFAEDERNFYTLTEMLKCSEIRENDDDFKNVIDWQFEAVDKWINNNLQDDDIELKELFGNLFEHQPTEQQKLFGNFACRKYTTYKLAAGKLQKSVIASCTIRTAVFSKSGVTEITSKDSLNITEFGDMPTAIFIVRNSYDYSCDLITKLLWTQLFDTVLYNLYTDKQSAFPIHFLIDDFQEIGILPNIKDFLLRPKSNVTASFCVQSIRQLQWILDEKNVTSHDHHFKWWFDIGPIRA